MKKSELKKVLKPLVKECIKEVLFEEGILSGVISEVVKGLGTQPIVEQKQPTQNVQIDKKLIDEETKRRRAKAS